MTAVETGPPAVPPGGPPDRPPIHRNFGVAAGSFVVSVVIGMVSSIATSRLYGIEVIGEYALASLPYVFISQLSSVKEQTAFVREVAGLPRRDARMSALWRAVLLFSTALTAGVALLALLVAAALLDGAVGRGDLLLPAVVIVAGYVLLDNVGWNIDAAFSAFRAAGHLFAGRSLQVGTFLVAGVALSFVDDSVWGLVWATVLSFAVPLAYRLCVLPRYVSLRPGAEARRGARRELPALVRFGVVLLPSVLLSSLVAQAGVWVLGATASVASTGAYSRAWGLASKFSEAGYRISEILLPGMVERYRGGDDDGARALLHRTLRVAAVPLVAVAAAGSGAATGILRVFGEGFDRANVALAFLLTGFVVTVLSSMQSQQFLAAGRPSVVTKVVAARATVALATVYPLALVLGATGVALSFLLASLVSAVSYDSLLGRLVGRSSFLGARRASGLVGSWAAGYAAAWLLVQVSAGIPMTIAALAAGLAIATTVAVGAGVLSAEERRRALDAARARVSKR